MEGPILRYLGLCSLSIETAGGGQGSAMGSASLPGVANAQEFRDLVLDQRDLVATGPGALSAVVESDFVSSVSSPPEAGDAVLVEIRDSLLRIEAQLAKR